MGVPAAGAFGMSCVAGCLSHATRGFQCRSGLLSRIWFAPPSEMNLPLHIIRSLSKCIPRKVYECCATPCTLRGMRPCSPLIPVDLRAGAT